MEVLNTIYGDNRSSRLFQNIREKEGIIYILYSYIELFSDIGRFLTYFVVSPAEIPRIIKNILKVLKSLSYITAEEVRRAKNYLKKSILLNSEDPIKRIYSIFKDEAIQGTSLSFSQQVYNIDTVAVNDIEILVGEFLDLNRFSIYLLTSLEEKEMTNLIKEILDNYVE